MTLARAKTWSTSEVLTADNLNSEFDNILTNATTLFNPATASVDLNGNVLIVDADADSTLTSDTDDRLDVRLGGVDLFRFDGTTASCVNGLDFTGTITTAGPIISAIGSDTNIEIILTPKGTGSVVLGGEADASSVLAAQIFS